MLALLAALSGTADAGSSLQQRYLSLALQGDLAQATELFEGPPVPALTDGERELKRRFFRRFIHNDEPPPSTRLSPFVDGVMSTYREYWRRSLMRQHDLVAGEAWLTRTLAERLVELGLEDEEPRGDDVHTRVLEHLERAGYHATNGVTRPYFDLMIWTRQRETFFGTRLTDGWRSVRVVFLDGVLIKGWSHFATFGRASTGGWATRDALYCLEEDYDLDSENFRVSYLKHESRHLADYELFPRLAQADLEYRAKLTELAFAHATLDDLLADFAGQAENNPAAPHALANHAVIRDLSSRLGAEGAAPPWPDLRPARVRRAARQLLGEHTRRLRAAGAASTTGTLAAR